MNTNWSNYNKREYEDRLERVLSKKNFSKDVKNIIRTMFTEIYKVYDTTDMQEITGKNKLKYISDHISNIEKNCNSIKISHKLPEYIDGKANIKTGEVLLSNKLDEKNSPRVLLHELEHLTQKGYRCPFSYIIEAFLRNTLCEGDSIIFAEKFLGSRNSNLEFREYNNAIVFPGFSINSSDYSIYTMLLDLLGRDFMIKWRNDTNINDSDISMHDYLKDAKNILSEKYGENLATIFFQNLSTTLLLQYKTISPEDFQAEIAKYYFQAENFQKELSNRNLNSLGKKSNIYDEHLKNIEEGQKLFDYINDSNEINFVTSYRTLFETYKDCVCIDIKNAKTVDEIYTLQKRVYTCFKLLPEITRKHPYFDNVPNVITNNFFKLDKFKSFIDKRIEKLTELGKTSCLPPLSHDEK